MARHATTTKMTSSMAPWCCIVCARVKVSARVKVDLKESDFWESRERGLKRCSLCQRVQASAFVGALDKERNAKVMVVDQAT
jgi:hypothetical protein